MMDSDLIEQPAYVKFLDVLKEHIRIAQTRAVLSINKELISLYGDIGKRIVESQKEMGWGKSVVEQLAFDLRREFPDVRGFSARNLWVMRLFYLAYKDDQNLRQVVAEYSLRDMGKLIGVSEYKHTLKLPKELSCQRRTHNNWQNS